MKHTYIWRDEIPKSVWDWIRIQTLTPEDSAMCMINSDSTLEDEYNSRLTAALVNGEEPPQEPASVQNIIDTVFSTMKAGDDRYNLLMIGAGELTQREIMAGWHFCAEFDGLLIGPGMDEMKVCRCPQP